MLVKIINEYNEGGYCIDPVIIDDNLIDAETDFENRVFKNLSKCNYAFVFMSEDLRLNLSQKYVSKPNVTLELGFLMGQLSGDCIWCIIDFPYEKIQKAQYIAPTDILGKYYYSIDKNNTYDSIKQIFDKFIAAHKDNIDISNNYNSNDLVTSLVLNSNYKTDYNELFTDSQLESIKKYSLELQLKEILNNWIEEKGLLNNIQATVYLFERIIFLPFFPNKIIQDKLNDFLYVDENENPYISACCNILRNIRDYENYKRQGNDVEVSNYYLDRSEEISKSYEVLNHNSVAPIIKCCVQDYLGLCYLNAYLLIRKGSEEVSKKEYLEESEECFNCTLKTAQCDLGDNLQIFQAFARYNLARVKSYLGKNADGEYSSAIQYREFISKTEKIPPIFKLNFLLEKILAENSFIEYLYEKEQISEEEYKNSIQKLVNKLDEVKHTSVTDISLFKTLENNLKNKMYSTKI